MENEANRYIGFMVVLLGGGVVAKLAQQALQQPQVIEQMTQVSPWLGQNAVTISWVSMIVIVLATLAIPPVLIKRDDSMGNDQLAGIGAVTSTIVMAIFWGYIVLAFLPSVGFLLGLGWFFAKSALIQ